MDTTNNSNITNINASEEPMAAQPGITSDEQKFYPRIDSMGNVIFVKREDHKFLKIFKDNYKQMLLASVIYAIVFTFSLYRNFTGIVTPLFPIASIALVLFCAKKVKAEIRKDTIFYIVTTVLIGINLCTTMDLMLIFIDYVAILLLTVSMSLHIFYDDSKWGLGKYLSQIIIQLVGIVEYLFSSLEDGITYKKNKPNAKSNPLVGYIILGVIITIPLLTIILLLLGTADYFFGQFLNALILEPLSNIDLSNIDLLFMLVVSFAISYGFIRKLCVHNLYEKTAETHYNPAAIAVTINSILGFVYLVFSGFQIVNLFMGNAKLPENYTYAEYAREGFFQLVVVCLINMILVLISLYFFENKKVLKITLTIICACTYLMIVSSAYRMFMYVDAYQLTYTRLFVFFALIVIFMFMNGITVYIYYKNFNLFKYCMVMLTVLYIAFAFSKPESIIARNNLSEKFYNSDKCEDIDYKYLERLSSDASPAIFAAFERENDEKIWDRIMDYKISKNPYKKNKATLRSFNFSSYQEYLAYEKIKNKL